MVGGARIVLHLVCEPVWRVNIATMVVAVVVCKSVLASCADWVATKRGVDGWRKRRRARVESKRTAGWQAEGVGRAEVPIGVSALGVAVEPLVWLYCLKVRRGLGGESSENAFPGVAFVFFSSVLLGIYTSVRGCRGLVVGGGR